jgi:hypothetical protein
MTASGLYSVSTRGADGGEMPVIDDFDALVGLVAAHDQVYVRYSQGPDKDGERSVDYESDVELPGLSVTNLTPEPWWPRPWADWIARRVCKYAELGGEPDRRPWALLGRVVGNGPDHEPLVTDVLGLGWIGPRAIEGAERRYRERFNVGRAAPESGSSDPRPDG